MLDDTFWNSFRAGLSMEQRLFVARFPGDTGARQPVSVLYGGAHLFKSDTPVKLGALAKKAFDEFAAPEAFGLEASLAERVLPRVKAKLEREPIEDLRIDFEDGFGHRSDEEEDATAKQAARELSNAKGLPPFIGIRVKPMTEELGVRAVRTLELFFGALRQVPDNFVVTLPKVTSAGQVKLLVKALSALGANVKLEVMVEAVQGLDELPKLFDAAQGRLRGAHFGTYDYTASLGIAANEQRMQHPACDDAKAQMQRAFAGTGVWLSDGATTAMPIAKEGREAVHAAWRQSMRDTRHSLAGGFYQGWDLHPAQLVSRYAAVYAFFLENLEASTQRLRNFVDKLGQATLVGTTFDDAATGQGLLNFFLRGLACGALTEEEVLATGLTRDELASKSFARIAKHRRG